MRFAKAHGLGNDFLIVADADVPAEFGPWARRLCDRHCGIGADGVLRYSVEPPNVRMRLINADGGEVELSGNGVRCLAAYVHGQSWVPASHTVLTPSGPRPVVVQRVGRWSFRVETDLGPPILRSDLIPAAFYPVQESVVDHPLSVGGETVRVTLTSMGNPHCSVFFDAPVSDTVLSKLGPLLETHALFPKRTNVEFVTALSRSELRVRFWERGVGYTRASGTGSAGAFVAAALKGLCEKAVRVVCDGGILDCDWPAGGSVHQTGPVDVVCEGEWLS